MKKKPSTRSTKKEKKEKQPKGRGGGRGGGKKKHDLEGSPGSIEAKFQNLSLQEVAALAEGDNIEESEDC